MDMETAQEMSEAGRAVLDRQVEHNEGEAIPHAYQAGLQVMYEAMMKPYYKAVERVMLAAARKAAKI